MVSSVVPNTRGRLISGIVSGEDKIGFDGFCALAEEFDGGVFVQTGGEVFGVR